MMVADPGFDAGERRATWLVLADRGPALGRAFTRRQLMDRVWGLDQVGDPRTVDVHIRWLRSKVEREPGKPVHLMTVSGVGYGLDLTHR